MMIYDTHTLGNAALPPRSQGGWTQPVTQVGRGIGAVFRIQAVKAESILSCDTQSLAEIEADVFAAFLASLMTAGCRFTTLDEAHRRLASGGGGERITCLTFDGATRGIVDHAFPLLEKAGIPFTVFVSPQALDEQLVPWWDALAALVMHADALSFSVRGQTHRVRCRTGAEKSDALDTLIPFLMTHPEAAVRRAVYAHCEAEGLSIADLARNGLLAWSEIKALAKHPLVTIGLMAPDCHAAGSAPYDSVKAAIIQQKVRFSEVFGVEPAHLAFSAGWHGFIEPRDLDIAASAGFRTASLPGGGALFPEEPSPFFSLPRVLLSNDPNVLLDAQIVAGAGLEPQARQALAAVS